MTAADWEQHAYAKLLEAEGSTRFALSYLTGAINDERTTPDELRAMVTGQDRARKELAR